MILEHQADAASVRRDAREVFSVEHDAPASGGWSPAMTRSSVVLPEPLGPSTVTISPLDTSSDAPSTTASPSNRTVTFSTRSSSEPPAAVHADPLDEEDGDDGDGHEHDRERVGLRRR